MTVEKANHRVKCDDSGCNNIADFAVVNKKFVFSGNVYLCASCMNTLYAEIGKFIKPKNVKPLYRKGDKNE